MLLTDEGIDSLLKNKSDAVVPSPGPLGKDPNRELRIQPSSVDLTIGGIYRPSAGLGKDGSDHHPLKELALRPGHTAVVETNERLNLPPNICAIGFPPSHVSSKGILMTNPGHVDPGYEGTLTFTVINMGRNDYPLKIGLGIVTLLLFELSAPPRFPYPKLYTPQSGSKVTWEMLEALSEDFVSVEKRARKIARAQAVRVGIYGFLTTLVVGLVAVFGYFSTQASLSGRVDDLQRQITLIQAAQHQSPTP